MICTGKTVAVLISACVLAGCARPHFEPKPIDVDKISAKLAAKDITDEKFQQYLLTHGYQPADLPISNWGLDELTLCALYFHPKLDVAKAELAHNQALIDAAQSKPAPSLNGHLGHSNLKNGDSDPWAYGLSVEIPIETGGKRALATEQARKQADIARMEIADMAWQLRSQIETDLLRYQQNIATVALLNEEASIRDEIVAMLQKRLDKGLASSSDVSREQLNQAQSRAALRHAQSKQAGIHASIVSDVGLNPEKITQLPIKATDIKQVLAQQAAVLNDAFIDKHLQTNALLNRIDMRHAITNYEIAETSIRQAIAKQYPDFSLSPGVAFEFGDTIWSLGISSLLLFTQQNHTHIVAAERLREVEGAKLEALQSQIISQLHQSYQQYTIAEAYWKQAESQLASQQQLFDKQRKQFDKGLIDRLALKQAELLLINAKQQLVAAQFEALDATHQIENAMQAPLFSHFVMPEANPTP
jgi:outer membrane protein, heavy metal efflux system